MSVRGMDSVKQTHVDDVMEFKYCPLCGERVTTETVKKGQYRSDIEVICPNHGMLEL